MKKTIKSGRTMYGLARAASTGLMACGVAAMLAYAWTRVDERLYQRTQESYLPAVSTPTAIVSNQLPTMAGRLTSQLLRRWTGPDPKVIGKLVIPALKIDVIVREGTDSTTLRRSVGHLPGTALPGKLGNFVVTGHRDTLFRPLRNIHKDDDILAIASDAIYTYRVYQISVVAPDYIQALQPTSQPECTLITCFPFEFIGAAPRRFIVHARVVGTGRPPRS